MESYIVYKNKITNEFGSNYVYFKRQNVTYKNYYVYLNKWNTYGLEKKYDEDELIRSGLDKIKDKDIYTLWGQKRLEINNTNIKQNSKKQINPNKTNIKENIQAQINQRMIQLNNKKSVENNPIIFENIKNNSIEPKNRNQSINKIVNNQNNQNIDINIKHRDLIEIIDEKVWRKKYDVISKLGSGSFGVTYKVLNKDNDVYEAMKIININKSVAKNVGIESILFEIKALENLAQQLNNFNEHECTPNIVCYYNSFISTFSENKNDIQTCIFVFSEYIEGIELFSYIYDKNKVVPDINIILKFMKELSSAVKFIHDHGFSHRDLKPENIVLNEKTNTLYIIDFGLSCSNDNNCTIVSGTKLYLPPKILLTLEGAKSQDVWALGVIFFELANYKNGKSVYPYKYPKIINFSIFETMNDEQIKKYIKLENSAYENFKYYKQSRQINNIINSMLTINNIKRPKINEIVDEINKIKL